ncbi:UDP-2,4-diacetamido-2,4,6-trideoxy-beta-L-altropyranose hydrolase [Halomonas sp. AOP22-C1-8]|uniref:UDP-2,4-diacetamido-2,4, 6-trideoxy-beta-L-altropyranose hydrolase n=1 Tax=Halomonas sp. AOP22-C1-8 TaxID=3457717 RepID=UPI0040332325
MNKPVYHNQKSSMVAFRADASLQIGSGHVMRCLTLAAALREQGAECHFLCREHPGHLIEMIEARGFTAHRLPMVHQDGVAVQESDVQSGHAHWLGASWQADAKACRSLLVHLAPDWLVVDHYALDAQWEAVVLPKPTRLMVIDDLADRPHRAALLLDQNLGRDIIDYADLVPVNCQVLAGPQFALLRPEFASLRDVSLARRRQHPQFRRLLISLGGVDKDNVTGQVLSALRDCELPPILNIEVVMGAIAPWLDDVKARAAELDCQVEVVVNVTDMAQRMANADLAIGAAGSTTWERCCLGLPTLMIVLAQNQWPIAQALAKTGGAICLGTPDRMDDLATKLTAMSSKDMLHTMSLAAETVTDGKGAKRLVKFIKENETGPL